MRKTSKFFCGFFSGNNDTYAFCKLKHLYEEKFQMIYSYVGKKEIEIYIHVIQMI